MYPNLCLLNARATLPSKSSAYLLGSLVRLSMLRHSTGRQAGLWCQARLCFLQRGHAVWLQPKTLSGPQKGSEALQRSTAVGEVRLLYAGLRADYRLRQQRRQRLMGFSALEMAGCWKALWQMYLL